MAIEASLSKFKRNNILIFAAILIGFGAYCFYDGRYSEEFIEKHTNMDGTADSTLVFNQKAPPYLIGVGLLIGAYLFVIKGRKIVANENELIINGKKKITYDSIEKLDKTKFDSKGFFVITYKDELGKETNYKISDKCYDNLSGVIDAIVAKIS